MQNAAAELISFVSRLMEKKGWNVGVEGIGTHVEISADDAGTPLRILVITPPEGTGPCFLRLERGEPDDREGLWAVISGVPLLTSEEDERVRELPSLQAALGDGWLVLGMGLWLGPLLSDDDRRAVRRLIELYLELGTEVSLRGRGGWNVFAPGASPLGPDAEVTKAKSSKIGFGLGSTLISGSVAGSVALALFDPFLGAMFAIQLGIPAVLGGLVAFAYHFKRQVAPRGCAALDRALRSSALFDEHEEVIAVRPLRPLVILDKPGRRSLGTIEFRAGLLGARSSRHDLGLRVGLQTLSSADSILPECRIVPDSWAVVELTGPEAILARLPSRLREERAPRTVRWLLDHDELVEGALDELLSNISLAVESSETGPYR